MNKRIKQLILTFLLQKALRHLSRKINGRRK